LQKGEKSMSVIRASESSTFAVPGFHFNGYTSPSRGATEICTWRLQIEPGAQSEAHWLDHEEVFLLLTGALTVSIAGEEIEIAAGDAFSVPARSLLQVSNRGAQLANAIACLPAGTQATGADGHIIGTPPWAR
jgi:mannose-6-phosphate isomerase-like protein (cupin superfamily)